MPQFCLLFYAILQSWRPKGGSWHNDPPKMRPCQQHCTIVCYFLSNELAAK